MPFSLRLSIIMVLLLATTALGLIAYNMNLTKPVAQAAQIAQIAPAAAASGYLVAAHPLPAGTLAREGDFMGLSEPSGAVPAGAILDTPAARIGLYGSLVLKFLDTNSPITSQDVLRPRDRGFLATVLAPDTRAISINVDAESGVSGLIWPGDYVDVVLTQMSDKADSAHRSMSEIVLRNVRIIAIDQEIVEGAPGNNSAAGKLTHSVSLQLSPEQVKKIFVAKDLGKLSLAIRSASEQTDTADAGTMFGCDVSQEIAHQSAIAGQSATVVVYEGGKLKQYAVKKNDADEKTHLSGCDASTENARQSAAMVSLSGAKAKE
jgi:pilus assembly protein CpaB